jgi:ATP-dependent RNA helicase DHX57
MMQRFPSAVLEAARETNATHSTLPSGVSTPALDTGALQNQLTNLGFRPSHITSALSALTAAHARLHSSSSSTNDPLVLSLSILSPLEAGIEWLLLHLPEDDLPPRYRPSNSSSDFITGASTSGGGQTALIKGWLVDKLVKQAGFPRKAVERVLEQEQREAVALDLLGRRLCGWEVDEDGWGVEEYGGGWAGDEVAAQERETTREEELMAVEAVMGDRYREISPTEFTITIDSDTSKDNIILHIFFDPASPYPSPQYPSHSPSFYLTSTTLPSYMRLHLHAQLLRQFRDPDRHDLTSVLEQGAGGAILSMVEYLETTLSEVIDNPPDVGQVTQHLIPRVEELAPQVKQPAVRRQGKQTRHAGRSRIPSAMEQEQAKVAQGKMLANPGYKSILADRQKLPAWKERENLTMALESNRVMVVVGEVSVFMVLYRRFS